MTETLRPTQSAAPGRGGERAFPLLEGYRALAAALVVATHAGFQTAASLRGPWAGTLARMDFGVALFFVLSGFLLFRPHAAAHLIGIAREFILPDRLLERTAEGMQDDIGIGVAGEPNCAGDVNSTEDELSPARIGEPVGVLAETNPKHRSHHHGRRYPNDAARIAR